MRQVLSLSKKYKRITKLSEQRISISLYVSQNIRLAAAELTTFRARVVSPPWQRVRQSPLPVRLSFSSTPKSYELSRAPRSAQISTEQRTDLDDVSDVRLGFRREQTCVDRYRRATSGVEPAKRRITRRGRLPARSEVRTRSSAAAAMRATSLRASATACRCDDETDAQKEDSIVVRQQ